MATLKIIADKPSDIDKIAKAITEKRGGKFDKHDEEFTTWFADVSDAMSFIEEIKTDTGNISARFKIFE